MAKLANEVTGLILAGGEGRRMGGADKGLIEYQGRPLVSHVIGRLAPQVDKLLISANRNHEVYASYGFPVISDDFDSFQGPLAGLRAGLAACTTPWLACCPCDAPALPSDLVAKLLSAAESAGKSAAVAVTTEGMQPTFQLCRRDVLPLLDAFLAAGKRKVGGWCLEIEAAKAFYSELAFFKNINNQQDISPSA